MENLIFLNEVLNQMRALKDEKQTPFSLEWRTFNSKNKMGGKLKLVSNAILCMALPKKEKSKNPKSINRIKKNPNHWVNRTRNIETPGGDIVKVHIDLITKFNGKRVIF